MVASAWFPPAVFVTEPEPPVVVVVSPVVVPTVVDPPVVDPPVPPVDVPDPVEVPDPLPDPDPLVGLLPPYGSGGEVLDPLGGVNPL